MVVCSTDELFSRALGHALHDFEVEIVDQGRLPDLDGDALVWKINGAVPSNTSDVAARLPTLMLGDEQQLLTAVDAGCRGFLDADASIEEIRSAVLAISEGGAVIPPSMLGALLRHLVQRRRAADSLSEALATLTARELEVYRLAARGLGREQIARSLFISPDTVRTHLQKIYGKLGVHSRAELAALSAHGPQDDLEEPEG